MKSLLIRLRFKERLTALQAWQARKFVYILLGAFILGLLLAALFGLGQASFLPMAAAAGVLFVLALLLRMPSVLYAVILLLGVLWGGMAALQTDSFAVPPGEAVFFTGTVTEVQDKEENLFSQLAEYQSDTAAFIVRGRDEYGWRGKLLFFGADAAVKPGDKLELAGIVRKYNQTANFNLTDNNYLRNNGIGASVFVVPKSMRFSKLASPYTPLDLGAAVKDSVYRNMAALPKLQQALLKGIGFGETAMLTNGKKAVLQQTGIMHIFAVSGMHIAYVTLLCGAVWEFIRKRLQLGYKFVIMATAAVMLFFCLVVGLTPSVLRAAVMSFAAMLSLLLLREHSAGHGLIIAAFLLLLWQPRWICQPGFIMSFLATAGIIYTTGYWQALIPNKTLAACLAAQFMVMPVVAYFYNTVSFIGMLISPLMAFGAGIVVILIVMAMPLSMFGFGLWPLSGAGIVAELMYKLAEIFAGLPGAFTYTMKPGLGVILLYYLLLGAAFYILARYQNEQRHTKDIPPGEAGV